MERIAGWTVASLSRMKPMRSGLLALAAGLLLLRFLPALPSTTGLLALGGCALLLALLRWPPARLAALCLLGLLWACLTAQSVLDDRLAPAWDGRTLWLEGRIAGLPEQGEGVTR